MLNVDGATSQRLDELNLAAVQKVVLLTGEAGVRLLLNLEDDISGLDTRRLVTLATELNLGAAADTTVNVNVEDLAVDGGLLAVAALAAILVLDGLSLSVTVGTDSLESLDHGTHLAHHGLHTVAITASTALNCALLATATLTLGADDGSLQSQLGDLASVDILERDLVGVVNGAGLGRATVLHTAEHASQTTAERATAAEELGEEVLSSHAAAAGTTLEAGLTILIVNLALLGVGKDFVGMRDLLELALSIGVVCVLVCDRMRLAHGEFGG